MAGRLTKAARAQRTKRENIIKAQGKDSRLKPFTYADELEFITREKQTILDHPAKTKSLIGAKDTGKNRMINVRILRDMASNNDLYGLGLRKYKIGAQARLHTAISNMALEIRSAGFNVPEMESSTMRSYMMKNKFEKTKNQSIEYSSFDDINGMAGIEAPNLGQFTAVEIDEPVLMDDPGKMPDKDEWKNALKMVRDSVDRSNRRYADIHHIEQVYPTWYLAMNPWDDHPEVVEAEENFPEAEFLEWVLKDPVKNHTKAKYNPTTDKLYARFTKFANPTLDKDKLLAQINKALEEDDKFELTRLLGLKNENEGKDPKVWRLNNLEPCNTIEEIEGKKILGYSQGWDIDVNRQLTFTEIILAADYNIITGVDESTMKIYVLPQKLLPAYGKGAANVRSYIKQMEEMSVERLLKIINMAKITKPQLPYGIYCYFDENQTEYSWSMDRLRSMVTVSSAKKHGVWGRNNRVNNIQIGIDNGKYKIDKENIPLINNMAKATRKEGALERDESSTKEKNYDEINSFEYALYPFRGMAY